MIENLSISIFLLLTTVINIVVPLPGSSVITPVLAILINDPQRAIAFVSIYFFLSGIIRAYMFKEHIVRTYVRQFLLLSILFSILGALALITINNEILYGILFVFILWSFVKMLAKTFFGGKLTTQGKLTTGVVGERYEKFLFLCGRIKHTTGTRHWVVYWNVYFRRRNNYKIFNKPTGGSGSLVFCLCNPHSLDGNVAR